MMYYAFDRDNNRMPGYMGPEYNGSYGPIIEHAIMHCGEGGHVEDENGETVWTWEDWAN